MNAYDVIVTQQHKAAPQINYVLRRWATAEVRRESAIAVSIVQRWAHGTKDSHVLCCALCFFTFEGRNS